MRKNVGGRRLVDWKLDVVVAGTVNVQDRRATDLRAVRELARPCHRAGVDVSLLHLERQISVSARSHSFVSDCLGDTLVYQRNRILARPVRSVVRFAPDVAGADSDKVDALANRRICQRCRDRSVVLGAEFHRIALLCRRKLRRKRLRFLVVCRPALQ